ncbi:hypothetical protein IKG20_02680 [Candidatus Saccharibacteria bacterium]|nr:hypothetical protein [Candidatus Saccharibacteria bacterium]
MPEPAPYWDKNPDLKKIKEDLSWNLPEQKQGTLSIIGGNSSSFSTEVKVTEYANRTFPFIKEVKNIFPDSLKSNFPPIAGLEFYPSTDSGSFADSKEFKKSLEGSDYAIFLGDLSRNSITAIAITEALKTSTDVPTLLTRDAVDLIAPEANDVVERDNVTIVASLASLQKLFRALYYPRPILLSQPILPVIETLHKFTLSYPISILTFHEGKIICATSGDIATVDINKTKYSPLSLWSGELALNIAVFSMFNKNKKIESMLASVL